MPRTVRWEEMFPDELDAALQACPVVYLTYGLCEPHGLHAATGLDAIKAHALALRAASAHGGIVAPPFFWHIQEMGLSARFGAQRIGERNPWVTSLPTWVFAELVFYQLRAVAARGFEAALVITGHYGGPERDLKELAAVFMRHSPLRVWAGADHEAIEYEDVRGDHAGRCETSQLWALRPELVDLSRLAPGTAEEKSTVMATGPDAGAASRRVGEAIVASQVAWLGRKAGDLRAAYRPPTTPAQRTPGNPDGALTFGETVRIWQAEVEPLLSGFFAMDTSPGGDRVAPSSSWAANEMSHAGLFAGPAACRSR